MVKQTWAKICGLRLLEDVLFCQKAGACAVGLNFWPNSKRYLDPAVARTWIQDLPNETELLRVGVFVNEPTEKITDLLQSEVIHIAQLHGDESPQDCAKIRAAGFRVWKAIGVRDASSLSILPDYQVDGVVLDAFCPGEYGGSGKTFQWPLAVQAQEMIPDTPIILSGGLTADNVAEAVSHTHPAGVDVASGVESAPGVKDRTLIERFIQAVQREGSA